MESLSDTKWDVVICGTGIRQSLLALYACPRNRLMDPNLTDLANSTVLYPGQERRFSTLTKTNTMEAQRQPSVYWMLQHVYMNRKTHLVRSIFHPRISSVH
jgi:hypothetical protein